MSEKKFKVGQVIKMTPGPRSHVTNPYYVQIDYYNPNAIAFGETIMVTSIPKHHSCEMIIGQNWDYHFQRMTIVGTIETHGQLLENQKFD